MLDALLFAVRNQVRGAGLGYDAKSCEIMDDGSPPPRCGNYFVAVHSGISRCGTDNNLDERFGFTVTLTMRVMVPLDRVGDRLIASEVARTAGPTGTPSFNARVEQLRAILHMNWKMTVQTGQSPLSANDNLAAWWPSGTVYGFIEPARFRGADAPVLVGGEWFSAMPEATDVGVKADLRFDGARRMQPQTLNVGPFA